MVRRPSDDATSTAAAQAKNFLDSDDEGEEEDEGSYGLVRRGSSLSVGGEGGGGASPAAGARSGARAGKSEMENFLDDSDDDRSSDGIEADDEFAVT